MTVFLALFLTTPVAAGAGLAVAARDVRGTARLARGLVLGTAAAVLLLAAAHAFAGAAA